MGVGEVEGQGRWELWCGPKGGGGAQGWEPEVGGPKGGGPKFRAFFSLSRRKIRSFLPSLGVFSWNFGGV